MDASTEPNTYLILSDLHIGHPASLVEDIGQLAPLFERGRTIVFNGDTFEMRRPSDREDAARNRAELEKLLASKGVKFIFVTGNHDPIVSEINHLELPTHRVLITHGDILFHQIAPWSMNARLYDHAHTSEIHRLPAGLLNDLKSRLAAMRRATLAYDIHHRKAPHGIIGLLVHLVETVWPPWRPLLIVKCWKEIPSRALRFIQEYRPDTRFLIIGHSHYAGVWKREDLTVINTGAFVQGFGRRAVLIDGDKLSVRDIDCRNGAFSLGQVKKSFDC